MGDFVRFVGPNRALELFGVKLVGINAENGRKLLFSIAFVIVMLLINAALHRLAKYTAASSPSPTTRSSRSRSTTTPRNLPTSGRR